VLRDMRNAFQEQLRAAVEQNQHHHAEPAPSQSSSSDSTSEWHRPQCTPGMMG
jgi:hypothetical protein